MSDGGGPTHATELPDGLIIFISYRRADTRADAGRLYDALRRRFGADQLFMDVDSLLPGQDWVAAIDRAVESCDVVLALIGPAWISIAHEEGGRRLEDELDRVRLEIASALKQGRAVIPVLFGGARMPRAGELPEDLRPLLRRHAMRIEHDSFRSDFDQLARALRTLERQKAAARAKHRAGTEMRNKAEEVEDARTANLEADLQAAAAAAAEQERQAAERAEMTRRADEERRRLETEARAAQEAQAAQRAAAEAAAHRAAAERQRAEQSAAMRSGSTHAPPIGYVPGGQVPGGQIFTGRPPVPSPGGAWVPPAAPVHPTVRSRRLMWAGIVAVIALLIGGAALLPGLLGGTAPSATPSQIATVTQPPPTQGPQESTAPPTPGPSPVLGEPALFDDFTAQGTFEESYTDEYSVYFAEGSLVLEEITPQRHLWSVWSDTAALYPTDVFLQVLASAGTWQAGDGYGVVCRYLDAQNFYYFLVGADGSGVIGEVRGGQYATLGSGAVVVDPARWVVVSAECVNVGAEVALRLSVDGSPVVEARGLQPLAGGRAGVTIDTMAGGLVVAFDDFTAWVP